MKKITPFIILASFLLIGAGCNTATLSPEEAVVIDPSMIAISDIYFNLPESEWTVSETDSDDILILNTVSGETSLSVDETYSYFDWSELAPTFSSEAAVFYSDGCGGGWCEAYIIEFNDESQYSLMLSGDPISDQDVEDILMSIIK